MRTLVLVPTELECRAVRPAVAQALGADDRLEMCGFGPVAAAARAAALLAGHRPARVLLLGIAGRIDERLALGAAYRFGAVACHGIGAGTGTEFVPAGALSWPQWPGDVAAGSPVLGDVLSCGPTGAAAGPLLLSACAASASAADVRARQRLFPAAAAEDMEGFAVAFASRLHGVPCEIVRGLSNVAGDREQARWVTAEALAATAVAAAHILAEGS